MLNEAQQKFVEATLRGEGPKAAAIAAGLSESTAASAGSRMRKHPKIIAALEAIGFSTPGAPLVVKLPVQQSSKLEDAEVSPEDFGDPLPETTDSVEFLEAVLAHPNVPLGRRMEAAKLLMPFQHGKVGDKGKKQEKADGAKATAAGDNAYATRKPPALKSVPK